VPALLPFSDSDAITLTEFLRSVDLTVSGIGEPELRLWLELDKNGRIVGSTGFELDGSDALPRSVAVHPSLRGSGRGRAWPGSRWRSDGTRRQARVAVQPPLRPVLAESRLRTRGGNQSRRRTRIHPSGESVQSLGSAPVRDGLVALAPLTESC
jgi:hypothetical protein